MALTSKETNEIIKNKSLRAASKRRTATKIIIVVLLVSLLLTGGTYGVLTLIEANSMMITINQERSGLSLSETKDFSSPTSSLDMKGPDNLDAHTYTWFREDNILGYEGAHHTGTYIAYSFYLKNINLTSSCKYAMNIEVTKNTLNVASAMRIAVIEYEKLSQTEISTKENLSITRAKVYAKAKEDATNEYVAYNECLPDQKPITLESLNEKLNILDTNLAVPFLGKEDKEKENSPYYVMNEKGRVLEYNTLQKFTILIWLEGTDLQCVNDIVGGRCSINVNFELEEYLDPEYYG